MALKLFNTLTRKKEVFKPIIEGTVRMYTCGPTVYNFAHIGNLRAYIFEDQLRRYLKSKGYKVTQVMNLTDVDDKTINGSRQENVPLYVFTEKYKKAFFEDINTLNIERAEFYPEATKTVAEMIELIEVLIKNGYAYKGEDNCIYYSIKKFKNYGKLAHINVEDLKSGARVKQDEYEKEHAADFALWKAWDENDGDVFWESPWGRGRPGWHIECSAMSMKHLSEAFKDGKFNPNNFQTIDIHTGGVDNLFPHHEDEIAQSEGATGKKFVKYWMHNEHLLVDGKKMSKSLGNFYTLRDLLDKGFKPKAIRYVLMSTHYRQQLNFTFESISAAENTIEKFRDFILKIQEPEYAEELDKIDELIANAKMGFEEAMDDDLNISAALAAIFDFMKNVNILVSDNAIGKRNAENIIELMKNFDKVLGILDFEEEIPEDVIELAQKRDSARKNKDFRTADKIREEIKKKGYLIDDTSSGFILKKV